MSLNAPLNAPLSAKHADNAALNLLLTRRSCHALRAPGPDDDELARMLRAARRTPDFGHLRPYRFLAARGEGLDRLGEAMQRAAIAAGKSEKIIARALTMPRRAPLVLVVVASPQTHDIVSEFDQILCAGSSVLTLHLAARSMGYGSIWRSGWMMRDRAFHAGLGLSAREQIVGLLYVGTPDEAEAEATASLPDGDPFDRLTWL
jgi:nitroreductase